MTKRIYVGNFPTPAAEHEISSLFERVGRVVSVRIMPAGSSLKTQQIC
jgi:RNA recognition motif-containing protein